MHQRVAIRIWLCRAQALATVQANMHTRAVSHHNDADIRQEVILQGLVRVFKCI